MDLFDSFWRPFGQHLLGVFISHFRKQKVTLEGGKVVMRDLNEYCNVSFTFHLFYFSLSRSLSPPPPSTHTCFHLHHYHTFLPHTHTLSLTSTDYCRLRSTHTPPLTHSLTHTLTYPHVPYSYTSLPQTMAVFEAHTPTH